MSGQPVQAPFADAEGFVGSIASPLAGRLIAIIGVLVVAILGWAAWATIEEVVRADGRAEPTGQVKLVNHPRGGLVSELLVAEGQLVTAGDTLLRLDASVGARERDEVDGRLALRRAEVARLEAEVAGVALQAERADPPIRPDLLAQQRQLQQARAAGMAARVAALTEAVAGRRGDLAVAGAELDRTTAGARQVGAQAVAVRELTERGLYPKLRFLALEKQRVDSDGERQKAVMGRAAATAALAEARARLSTLEREWRSTLLAELAEATGERDRLTQQARAMHAMVDGLELRAPVTGTVLDLTVKAPGQAVAANDTILRLVPAGGALLVQARVANADIGRVHPGMPARVKVSAYDWLRFGTLQGTVTRIAADATSRSEREAPSYVVTVTIDRQQLGPTSDARPVVPGMAAQVEFQVGSRNVLSYLTDQFRKLGDAATRGG